MSLNELKQSPFDNKTIIILMVVIIVVLALDVLVRMDVINPSSVRNISNTVTNSDEPPPPLPEPQTSFRVFEVLELDPENQKRFIVSELDSEAKRINGPAYVPLIDDELTEPVTSLFITDSAAEFYPRDKISVGSILEVVEYMVAQNGVVVSDLEPPLDSE